MAVKLDDFLAKKKEVAPILDLSKCTANSKEELKKLLEKVPEFRMRPEKIKPEDIKIREKDFTFKTPKRELKPTREYQFVDPVPVEMRGVRLEDLSSVNIPWRMLTTLRPKNKIEDDFFSRLVELGKLRLQTEEREKRISMTDFVRKMKSKAGIVETRVISCRECGEEFCSGETCCELLYEAFVREDMSAAQQAAVAGGPGQDDERGRARKKKRRVKSKGAPTTLMRDISRSKSKATRERRKSKSREGRKSSRGRKSSKSRDRKSSKSGERKSSDRTKKKVRKKRKKKKKSSKKALEDRDSSDLE